jgi:hypothetical protein
MEKVYKGRVGNYTIYQLFVSTATAIANPCTLLFACIAPKRRFIDAHEALGGKEQYGQGEGDKLRD